MVPTDSLFLQSILKLTGGWPVLIRAWLLQDMLRTREPWISTAAGGVEICRGTITKIDDRNEGGYYFGTVTVDCPDAEYAYWFKNENFIAWKNGMPLVTGPDILTAIDLDTFEPVANQASCVGQKIALIAIPIHAGFRHGAVYEAMSPRAFGFDFDHQPIERLWPSVQACRKPGL